MESSFFDALTLLGSLGLFLYGMKVMSDALMELAGDRLRSILATATANRFLAVATGFAITAIIQSSSATTLMVVSFANASLLSLVESIGVIMGANIGTTITAWLISLLGFKVDMASIAIPLVGLGFFFGFSKRKEVRHWGTFLVGFALLFIGLQFMKDAVPDLKSSPDLLAFLSHYANRGYLSILLFLVIGTLLTVILQSSSATMAITIIMCFEGWIPFPMAAAMVLGENIGTTITANLAALVANYQAKRTARAHLIFNTFGVLWMLVLFFPFIHGVGLLVQAMDGASPFVQASAIPVALALFHTLFNVANTALLIGLIPAIASIVKRVVPEETPAELIIEEPHYLDEPSLRYPQTGIKALLDESLRLLEKTTYKVLAHGLHVHRQEIESEQKLNKIVATRHFLKVDIDSVYYHKFKNIYGKIVEYATRLQGAFDLDEEKIIAIRSILRADRLMVEIVKEMKPLHQNLERYCGSSNPYIRDEYNRLRRMILKILRLSRKVREGQLDETYQAKIQRLRDRVDRYDVLLNGTVDRLVRENLITSEMATSLMNDSAIAMRIAHNLVDVSWLLYQQRDTFQTTEDAPKSLPVATPSDEPTSSAA